MKCGLKTFPLPIDLSDEVKLVEAEFGVNGFAVYIKLMQAIYARGYNKTHECPFKSGNGA